LGRRLGGRLVGAKKDWRGVFAGVYTAERFAAAFAADSCRRVFPGVPAMMEKIRPVILTAFAVGGFALSHAAAADLKPVDLGGKFEVFALHPETGDLAALDAKASTVTLFRSDFLTGKSTQ
jgi:hypothetical protein